MKKHVKMYKAGKKWCIATVTALSIVAASGMAASADDGQQTNQAGQQSQSLQGTEQQSNADTQSTTAQSVSGTNQTVSADNKQTDQQKDTVNNQVNQSTNDDQNASNNGTKTEAAKLPTNTYEQPRQGLQIDFNDNGTATGYLMKGTKLYADVTGETLVDTVADNNVVSSVQANVVNGRVLVKMRQSNTVAYVQQSDVQSQPQDVNDDDGLLHFTRHDMNTIVDSLDDSTKRAPQFEFSTLSKDVANVYEPDQKTGEMVKQHMGDSWPVTNPDGTPANYHGYHLAVCLVFGDDWQGKMGLFAQRIDANNQDISTWQYLGYVFNSFGEGRDPKVQDQYLDRMQQEWSGSTVMLHPEDTTIRFIYSNLYHWEPLQQTLTTAQVSVEPKDGNDWNSGLTINHAKATDHKTIFAGDGDINQINYTNVDKLPKFDDCNAMRDPHLVFDGDQMYVAFEANTGYKVGFQGINNFFNQANYGMSFEDYKKEQARLLSHKDNREYDMGYLSNASVGLVKLNSDYTVASIEKPLMVANAVNDEIERPVLFEHAGRWYLFVVTRGWHFATDNPRIAWGSDAQYQSFLLGYVSDDGIQGHYKKLNGNGIVLSSDFKGGTETYSFYPINNGDANNNRFVVTAYLTFKTFAPSYILEIDGDNTRIINDRVLDQGALVDNGHYYPARPQDNLELNGYIQDYNGDWRWYENNRVFTGFKFYTGAYYWFQDGVRQDNSFHEVWGKTYYTGADGRAVQGKQVVNGITLDFGDDDTYYLRSSGYLWDGSAENGGYRWYEDGQLYTGFRYYAGTYYWFVNGVRQNAGWREAWGYKYYTDGDGRAVQGSRFIDGKLYYFGNDDTYFSRPLTGYLWDGSAENGGYRWYENGELFTGFRYHTGTYYWFIDGVRQNAGWREAWGYKYYTDGDGRAVQGWQKIDGVDYYFGDDNTFYLR
ncbi:Glucan-binding domain (YG repeat) [Fructobacillus fructosus]|uniref:Glucan-binding domain (YG repeat) n=1 Tax=Fructobacillus fructosus TaxID=1631 RepID=A0ABN9YV31_9LACO|nr:Glucan-binding domain (YG repeat) [Fructobacillus fructosus]